MTFLETSLLFVLRTILPLKSIPSASVPSCLSKETRDRSRGDKLEVVLAILPVVVAIPGCQLDYNWNELQSRSGGLTCDRSRA